MKKVVKKRKPKRRQILNTYGEKKKQPRGNILGPTLATATGRVEGMPVRGRRI
jgi:hypothetical protein